MLGFEGAGAVFTGIFSAACLFGLPSTVVLHSEPAFRIPLAMCEALFLGLVLSALIFYAVTEKES